MAKTITVKDNVWEKLSLLKIRMKFKTFSDLFEMFIDEVDINNIEIIKGGKTNGKK